MSQSRRSDAPTVLLAGIEWSFIGERLSRAEFDAAVLEDQRAFEPDDAWAPEDIAIECPRIHLRYRCRRGDERVEPIVELVADNGVSFTQGELLFKIHNAVVDDLRDLDHHFLQGLRLFRPPVDEVPPLYDLGQGS